MTRKSVLLVIVLALAGQACSGRDPSDLPSLSAASAGSGGEASGGGGNGAAAQAGSGGESVATGGSAGSASSGGGSGSGGASGSGDASDGDVTITDVAASACEPLAAGGVKIMDSGTTNPAFDALGAVGELGARRYAFDSQSTTLLTFDADGANPSSFVYGAVSLAVHDPNLAVLFDDGSELYLQDYAATLTPVGGPLTLGSGTARAASLAARQDQALALWADADGLQGRLIVDADPIPLAIPEPLVQTARCASAAAASPTGFNVAWACIDAQTSVAWATVAENGSVSSPELVFRSAAPLELKQNVRTTHGNLLLLNDGSGQSLIVAAVDDSGKPKGAFQRYLGASGFGLAPTSSGVGLIAATPDGHTIFRVLDSSGAPKTAWKCLDEVSPGGVGAVMADGDGYTTLVRHDNGSAWMIDLDANGVPVP